MKTDFLRATLVALAAALLAPLSVASAQDIQLASHAEMNDVYARLADLESRLAATNGGTGCGEAAGCDSCCDDCCCGNPGFVGGVEILWLKAFHGEGDFADFNYDEGYRFWAGWEGASGLGARLRYFDYEQLAGNGDLIDTSAFDLEIYDHLQLGCYWDLYIGGGIRYLDLLVDAGDGADGLTGVGPTVSAELVRHVGERAALYAIVRDSIIAGNGGVREDVTTNVFEIQIGGQINREYCGSLLFARAGWEAQFYSDNTEDDSEGMSLMGGVLGVGLMR